MAGNRKSVQFNPECVGLYSFTDFIASAVCYNNPLKTGRYVGIMTTEETVPSAMRGGNILTRYLYVNEVDIDTMNWFSAAIGSFSSLFFLSQYFLV